MKGWARTTFESHEKVVCLRCATLLGDVEFLAPNNQIRYGDFSKRCPRCHLVTSYDVSPAEARAVEYEEPNWKERFEDHCQRFVTLPRYLQENEAFEQVLKDWRRWHATDDKPAGAVEAMIALAKLKIFPPRNLIGNTERTSACFQDQHDDHMWLTMSQRAWRIITIESQVMFLESFGEQTQVDLVWAKPRWEKWVDKAVEAMEAWTKKAP